jgi:hypothetical protein
VSLIDEALRRARQEAARQDAARQEERYRQVPVLPPMAAMAMRKSGCSRHALIGVAVAACVAAGIGIGIYLGRAPEPQPSPPPQAAAAAPPAPAVSVPETPQRPLEVMEDVPEEAPEPEPMPPTPVPVLTPEPQQVPVTEQETLEPPPALDPAPAPEPTPEPAPVPEVRTYVREVPLPDGGTLRLNGIAFSASQPVALINDKVLAEGESYQGFLVIDILANLVELRGNGMTIRVSLK